MQLIVDPAIIEAQHQQLVRRSRAVFDALRQKKIFRVKLRTRMEKRMINGQENELHFMYEDVQTDDMVLSKTDVWRKDGYLIWTFQVAYTRENYFTQPTPQPGTVNGNAATIQHTIVQYPISPEMDAALRQSAKSHTLRLQKRSFRSIAKFVHEARFTTLMSPLITANTAENDGSKLLVMMEEWLEKFYPKGNNEAYDANGRIRVLSIRPLRPNDDPDANQPRDLTRAQLDTMRDLILSQTAETGKLPCVLECMRLVYAKYEPPQTGWAAVMIHLYNDVYISLGDLRNLAVVIRKMYEGDTKRNIVGYFKSEPVSQYLAKAKEMVGCNSMLNLTADYMAQPKKEYFMEVAKQAVDGVLPNNLPYSPAVDRVNRVRTNLLLVCALSSLCQGIPIRYLLVQSNTTHPLRLQVDNETIDCHEVAPNSHSNAVISNLYCADGHLRLSTTEEFVILQKFGSRLSRAATKGFCRHSADDDDEEEEKRKVTEMLKGTDVATELKAETGIEMPLSTDVNRYVLRAELPALCAQIIAEEGSRPMVDLGTDGHITSLKTTLVRGTQVYTLKYRVLAENDPLVINCPRDNLTLFMDEMLVLRRNMLGRILNDRVRSSAPDDVRYFDAHTNSFAPEGVFDTTFFFGKQDVEFEKICRVNKKLPADAKHGWGLDSNRHYATQLMQMTHFPVFDFNEPIMYVDPDEPIQENILYYGHFTMPHEALYHGFVTGAVTQFYGEDVKYLRSKQVSITLVAKRHFRWVMTTAEAEVRIFQERFFAVCEKYNVTERESLMKFEINCLIGKAGIVTKKSRVGVVTNDIEQVTYIGLDLGNKGIQVSANAVEDDERFMIAYADTEAEYIGHFRPIQDYIYHKSRLALWRQMDTVRSLGVIIRGIKVDEIIVAEEDVPKLQENAEILKISDGHGNWKLTERIKKGEELPKRAPRIMTGGERFGIAAKEFLTLEMATTSQYPQYEIKRAQTDMSGIPPPRPYDAEIRIGNSVIKRHINGLLVTGTAGMGKSEMALKLMLARLDEITKMGEKKPKGCIVTWTHLVRTELQNTMDAILPGCDKCVETYCIQGLAPHSFEKGDKWYGGGRTRQQSRSKMHFLDDCDVVIIDEIYRYTCGELEAIARKMESHQNIMFIANGDRSQLQPIDPTVHYGISEYPGGDPDDDAIEDTQNRHVRRMFPNCWELTVTHRGDYGDLVKLTRPKNASVSMILQQLRTKGLMPEVTELPPDAFYITSLCATQAKISRMILGRSFFAAGDVVRTLGSLNSSIPSGFMLGIIRQEVDKVIVRRVKYDYVGVPPTPCSHKLGKECEAQGCGAARPAGSFVFSDEIEHTIDCKKLQITGKNDSLTHYRVGTPHSMQGISSSKVGISKTCICDPAYLTRRGLYVAGTRNANIKDTVVYRDPSIDSNPAAGIIVRYAAAKLEGYLVQDYMKQRENGVIKTENDISTPPEGYVTLEMIKSNLFDQGLKCFRCGDGIDICVINGKVRNSLGNACDFTLDRISNEFDHIASNVRPSHLNCNRKAHNQ